MPFFKKHNEEFCFVETIGQEDFFIKKGAMVGYKGTFSFDKSLFGPDQGGGTLGLLKGFAKRVVTGENIPLTKVSGSGIMYLAQNAYHVEIFELEPGDILTVESENLLAFPIDIEYDVRFFGQGMLSQGGMCSTTLTNNTRERKQVVLITDGNPLILETPCCVDPDAYVAHTGANNPNIKTDIGWKTFLGQSSGESYQFEFTQSGQYVMIQPSERLSSVSLKIDGERMPK